jgi:CelD/BcsL family acetyltransferase involved in cellulose biosynthesis
VTREEWTHLYNRCPTASPFLHPSWQLAWSEQFGTCPLRVFEVRRSGELVAMARCFEYNERLVFTGNGISDRLDILAADHDAAQELIGQLEAYKLDLQEIPAGSPLLDRFPHQQCSVCPVLDVTPDIPAKLARNLRQQKRYIADYHLETSQDAELLDRLFELHALQWQKRNEGGVLADPLVQAVHRGALNDLVRFHVLYVRSKIAGILYGFARNDTMHFYLSGFDPEWERYSPGSLLIEYAIEYSRSAGERCFDFLRGPEPYKYRWGAVDRPQYRIYS